jgi:PAS domain S-box-containing protein
MTSSEDISRFGNGSGGGREAIEAQLRVHGRNLEVLIEERTRELRESEERFRHTFEQAAVGMVHLAPDGKFIRVNRKFHEITGYASGELSVLTFRDITHPRDRAVDTRAAKRLLAGELSDFMREKRCIHKTGRTIWVRITMSLVRDDEGAPAYFITVVEDITSRKLAELELKRMSFAMEVAEDGIVWMHPDGRFAYANKAGARMHGYGPDELMGKTIFDISPGLTRQAWDERWKQLRRRGWLLYESTSKERNGATFPVEVRANHFVYKRAEFYVSFARDISDRKEHIRRIVRESTVNKAIAGVAAALISPDSTLKSLSAAMFDCARTVTGSAHGYVSTIDQDSGDLIAHTMTDIMEGGACRMGHTTTAFPRTATGYPGLWGYALNTAEPFFTNSPGEHPSSRGLPGGHVPLEAFLTAPAVYDGEVVGQIALANPGRDYVREDVLNVKLLADLFATAVNAFRTRERLALATRAAEQASLAKSEFLASMSHEIRTPLNAIQGIAHLLGETPLSALQRDYLDKMESASMGLLALVNDILDFSKIEAGALILEEKPFCLPELMDGLCAIFCQKAAEKGLDFWIDVDPDVPSLLVGDPLRLSQVLINLVGNAIKFTSAGEVTALARLAASGPGVVEVTFTVSDTGIGIEPEQAASLFEPFTQADASITRVFGGTGLGLSISKRLAELMGSEIAVSSRPGSGSAFSLTARFETASPFQCQFSPHELAGKSALFVTGDRRDSCVPASMLKRLFASVQRAGDADEAARIIRDDPGGGPDVVVVDCSGDPAAAGNALAVLSASARRDQPPRFCALAGISPHAGAVSPFIPGFDAVAIKPFTLGALADALIRALGFEAGEARSEAGEARIGAGLGKRLLVVEDNEVNLMVARDLLRPRGFHVESATNGKEALDRLASAAQLPDAVLMDLHMPVLDGFEAALRIRSDNRLKRLPVLALTADVLGENRDEALKHFDGYVLKPFTAQTLLRAIEKLLERDPRAPDAPPGGSAGTPGELKAAGPLPSGLPETLPGLNIRSGMEYLDGDVDTYRAVIDQFLHDHGESARRVTALAGPENAPALTRLSHSLAGVAGAIHAPDLLSAARALESCLRSGRPEAAPLAGRLAEEAARAVESARRVSALLAPEPDGPPPD